MKRIIPILFIILLASCDPEDILHILDKKSEHAYITNQTDCDVEVTRLMPYYLQQTTYSIKAGQQVEIAITDHWSMSLHAVEWDTVRFVFSDGTVRDHIAHAMRYVNDSDSVEYTPADNNILRIDHFSTDPKDNTWTYRNVRYNEYRYDYCITEK